VRSKGAKRQPVQTSDEGSTHKGERKPIFTGF